MKLTSYFRSTAAYRVRIALELKGLEYEIESINLLKGEQRSDSFKSINPQGLIPTLTVGDDTISQSMAILEYLEERHPEVALLPDKSEQRAYVRSLAQAIVSDIHPLNNLRVLQYLENDLGVSKEQKSDWYQHWVRLGFLALEQSLATSQYSGLCCFGDNPSLADVCLIPQVYNAHRFAVPMGEVPTILRINQYCLALPEFERARPESQSDFTG